MLIPYEGRKVYAANKPIDFRMGINSLTGLINRELGGNIHDGSLYVFHNKALDKLKIFFWDRNGFVSYYKRLEGGCKFKVKLSLGLISGITYEDLDILLSGVEPSTIQRHSYLEHMA
jgi:hypothetical protein